MGSSACKMNVNKVGNNIVAILKLYSALVKNYKKVKFYGDPVEKTVNYKNVARALLSNNKKKFEWKAMKNQV